MNFYSNRKQKKNHEIRRCKVQTLPFQIPSKCKDSIHTYITDNLDKYNYTFEYATNCEYIGLSYVVHQYYPVIERITSDYFERISC